MKRLFFVFFLLLYILNSNAYGNDNLKICVVDNSGGAYFQPTMQMLLDAPHITIRNKFGNKIATFSDNRGIPLMDYVMKKINIKHKASCYAVLDLFIYAENRTVPRAGVSMFLRQSYGKPTGTFSFDEIQQIQVDTDYN